MTLFGRKYLLGILGCGLLLLIVSARKSSNSRLEAKVPVSTISFSRPKESEAGAPMLPPPTVEDVRQAVARIYGDDVQVEGNRPGHYILGDFNGDGSEDLAVEVRPNTGELPVLDNELANWILEDPSQVFVPDPSKPVQKFPPKPPSLRVRGGQPLLVIVHGYGARGWRAAAARQSYLLVNAAGDSMELERKEDAMESKGGAQPKLRLLGDVIREKRGRKQGFLFWTGGHYAWHPL